MSNQQVSVGLAIIFGVLGLISGAPCTCSTPDVAPDESYTCAQQASFRSCSSDWMVPRGRCCQACRYDVPDYCIGDADENVEQYLNYTLFGDVGSAAELFALVAFGDVNKAANALSRAIALDIRTASRASAEAMKISPEEIGQVLATVLGFGEPQISSSYMSSVATAAARYYTTGVAQTLIKSADSGNLDLISEAIKTAARMHTNSAAKSLSDVVALGEVESGAVVDALNQAVVQFNNETLQAAAKTIAIVSEGSVDLGAYLINKILLSGGENLLIYVSEAAQSGDRCAAVGAALSNAYDLTSSKQALSSAISKLIARAPCLQNCCGNIKSAVVIRQESAELPAMTPEPVVVEETKVIQEISSVVVNCPRLRCSRFSGTCCNGQQYVIGDTCIGSGRREYKFTGVCKYRGRDALVVAPTSRGFDCYCY
eukprot:TRINITY_DN2190_c0_g2_i1.p2 TRINITY_DN2190_c0_g2~~TRINITY_DN2190_c0_g2_i1.p2  ORF type:complete len:428 (-),score=86.14 TRINITY_DN2190_c0_g2_i1:778-2061(-)